MSKVLNLTYTSTLTDLCEINTSFDSGVLRICYPGNNRNGSYISKDAIKKSLHTIYNCPIVCNYDRESDTLGGHDIEVIQSDNGLKIVNMTQPVGVIPESANVWFEDFEDEDGVTHEYLYADALLWKRQEAYDKIKSDGITSQSMEIKVNSGESRDGVYYINDFEFTAFALIGVEPCFESASIEVFSKSDFKNQMQDMMRELKETYSMTNQSLVHTNDDGGNKENNYSTEGGKIILEDKMNLAAKYSINVDNLDFSLEDFTLEELEGKFREMQESAQNEPIFALDSNIVDEICRQLSQEKISCDWGEYSRYCYADRNAEKNEFYCWDRQDWLLYGFAYTIDGDAITINYDSKKRMKYEIVEFDEGDQSIQTSPFAEVFAMVEERYHSAAVSAEEFEHKFNEATELANKMNVELEELKEFKARTEKEADNAARDDLFARFDDLNGVDEFEALKADSEAYTLEETEEKCFAIRGRNVVRTKNQDVHRGARLKVENIDREESEPYGNVFAKYGPKCSK